MKLIQPKDNRPTTLGLFDSGVGGLSVLRQLVLMSSPAARCRFIYLGDTARCPYGDRDAKEIEIFVRQILSWLQRQGADAIVMACNTSAALAGAVARSASCIPVYDLIGKAAEAVAFASRVGVLATTSTARSEAFTRAIKSHNADAKVTTVACPALVPLVERGHFDGEDVRACISEYCRPLISDGVEAVILGCTHYPFLLPVLREILPGHISIVDPAEHVALEVFSQGSKGTSMSYAEAFAGASIELFTTGDTESFKRAAGLCLGHDVGTVSGITAGELEALLLGAGHDCTSELPQPVCPN